MKSLSSVISYTGAWLVVAAGFALLCLSCSPSEKFLRSDIAAVDISAEDLNALPVTVTSSSTWMIDSYASADWLAASYDTNDPGLLWIKATGVNESLSSRTSEVVLVSGDGLTLHIPVVQRAMNVRFEVSPPRLEPFAARDTTVRTLTVSTDLAGWEFSILHSAEWLAATRVTADGVDANILTLSAEPTRSLDERRDTVVIRPVNEAFWSYADSIAVVQAGIDLLVTAGEAMNPDTFVIGIPASGGEVPLSVYSRAPWTVTADAAPAHVSIDLVAGTADIENGLRVVLTVAANTAAEARNFSLTFESAGLKYDYLFTQASAAPEPEPDSETSDSQTP